MGVLVLGVVFACGIIRRREKRAFDRKLTVWSGGLWLEVKIFLSLFVVILPLNVGYVRGWGWSSLEGLFRLAVSSGTGLASGGST